MMIGVLAPSQQRLAVEEFFQLFKVPWEWYRTERAYDAIVATVPVPHPVTAPVRLEFGAAASEAGRPHPPSGASTQVRLDALSCPLYGRAERVRAEGTPLAMTANDEPLVVCQKTAEGVVIRFGYDIFQEVSVLLQDGQPEQSAGVPTLDRHITFLRDVLLNAGLDLLEIPPVPAGHAFTVCLTHDIDHPSLRRHGFDHTTLGFLRRALLDTPLAALRGQVPVKRIRSNFAAALQLPLVQVGFAADPWQDFARVYSEIEAGLGATYFVLPRAAYPGRALHQTGFAPARRASAYAATDLASELEQLGRAGFEIGLHGIDAWCDSASGLSERAAVPATASLETGVRMHWLYFNQSSPQALEAAGFTYDSTCGYNATVGYRAGTSQVFRPAGVQQLLELPLHIMDTALFYPSYLHLTDAEAERAVAPMIDHALAAGGVLTLNWHDRSLFPERLWGNFYVATIARLKQHRPWFATAERAVAWFRRRRQVKFDSAGQAVAQPIGANPAGLPPLLLRQHRRRDGLLAASPHLRAQSEYADSLLDTSAEDSTVFPHLLSSR